MAEFLALAVIHFLAVVAPGPDFAVTIRQSLRHGRSAGVATAFGIGAGISVHVVYTLLGVGALMHATPWLLGVAGLVGGLYLLYLGQLFIRQAGKQDTELVMTADSGSAAGGLRSAFMLGFLTNATNPKATLFFLAVFTTVVSASTPLHVQLLYGVWMCAVNAGWFVLVSLVFTTPAIRERFMRTAVVFERLTGLVLMVFSIKLLWGFVELLPF